MNTKLLFQTEGVLATAKGLLGLPLRRREEESFRRWSEQIGTSPTSQI